MASKTNLPSVVSEVPRDLRDWINRVRETLERAEDSQGAASTTTVINYYGPGGGGGDGGTPWQPGDPLPCGNPVSPPAPTGLTVDAGFGFFLLTWDMPTYCGHSYTEVWGLRNDDLGAAVLLGSSIGQTFSYVVNEQNAYWCFWIRHTNILGQIGPYNQTGGVCAQTALDPGYLLDLLKGQITESQLYRDLGERINLIEPLKTQIESEKLIRENEDGIVAQRIDTVWAVADGAKAGVTDITTSRIGYCGKRAKDTTGAWTTTEYADKVACLATHADSGTYDYQWFAGLPWATAVKQVSVTIPNQCFLDNAAREVACLINGTRNSTYTTQVDCQAAGGVWRYLNTESNCITATGTDGKKGVWITGTTGALEQAFNATADELGKLSLQYTVKIDAGGHIAGFGLSSEPTAEGPNTSRFIVRADEFAICGATTVSATAPANPYKGQAWLNSTTNVVSYWTGSAWSTNSINASIPFVVVTNSPTVGGEVVPPGVYMDAAFIKNGTITSAKIKDAAITNAKILSLTASKIVSGTIAVDTYIQTSNYVPASTGWKLWTDASGAGYAEFNGGANGAAVTVRGTLYADRGWFKGCLLGGDASKFGLGTGFFAGWADANGQCVNPGTTGAIYKWRVGTPENQRMIWDGTALRVYDGANNELLRYGTSESWLRVLDAVNPAIERVRVGTLANGSKGIEIRDASGNLVLSSGGEINLGASANLVRNSGFAVDRGYDHYWNSYNAGPATRTVARDLSAPDWKPVGLHQVGIRLVGDGLKANNTIVNLTDAIAVMGGTRYELSAYVSSHRCNAKVWCKFFKADGSITGSDQWGSSVRASGGTNLSNWGRSYLFVTAPADAAYCYVGFNVPLPDTGVADCYAWATRFYLGEAKTDQTALSSWSPSTLGDIGDLGFPFTEGTIGTYMGSAAITTAYIKDGAIETAKIGSLQVTQAKIADFNVTFGQVYYAASSVAVNTIWTTVGSMTITNLLFETQMQILVQAYSNNSASELQVGLEIDGDSSPRAAATALPTFGKTNAFLLGVHTFGTGNHTIRVKARIPSTDGAALWARATSINVYGNIYCIGRYK